MSEPKAVPEPDDGFKDHFCQDVIGWGHEGYSFSEIAAKLEVPRSKLQLWVERREDFRDAMAHAADRAFAWWERKAREGLEQGTKLNTTVWAKSIMAGGSLPISPALSRERQALSSGEGRVR